MDDKNLNQITMEQVEKKFYGHRLLFSKYTPKIPETSEREYNRMVNEYMGILKEELEKELPELKEIYRQERESEIRENRRADSAAGILLAITRIFNTVKNNIILRVTRYNLEERLRGLAQLNRRMSTKEWERVIRTTLGIDIRKDYYLGSFYEEELAKWVSDNVDLIKTIPEETLDKMKEIVLEGYNKGKPTTQMAKDIQQAYGISKKRAKFIARDQTAKLNGDIQRAQQLDAGVTQYIWCTCGDERVRSSHRHLNGKIFDWNKAPVNDDGRACHPGEDFNCRCIGRPVLDKNTLNLPVKDSDTKVTITKTRR